MADAYGKLIFSCSKDAKFNSEKLVDTLNKFVWENSDGKWISEGDDIYYEGNTIQYPTVYPLYSKFLIRLINGVETKIYPSELTEENKEFEYDNEVEFVPLEDLRNAIVGHIKNGWIQIACSGIEKGHYMYLQQLRIYAEGGADRKKSFIGTSDAFSNTDAEELLSAKLAHKTEAS